MASFNLKVGFVTPHFVLCLILLLVLVSLGCFLGITDRYTAQRAEWAVSSSDPGAGETPFSLLVPGCTRVSAGWGPWLLLIYLASADNFMRCILSMGGKGKES